MKKYVALPKLSHSTIPDHKIIYGALRDTDVARDLDSRYLA